MKVFPSKKSTNESVDSYYYIHLHAIIFLFNRNIHAIIFERTYMQL